MRIAYIAPCRGADLVKSRPTTLNASLAAEVKIELVVAVEKHFNIRFNFAELQKFKNVGEMCDNIVTKLASTTN